MHRYDGMNNFWSKNSGRRLHAPSSCSDRPWWLDVMRDGDNGISGKSSTDTSTKYSDGSIPNKTNLSYIERQHPQFVSFSMSPTTSELHSPPTQLDKVGLSPTSACSDQYFGGLFPGYGVQPSLTSHSHGVHPSATVLPLEIAEQPVYVNPKQYHGILRRRQSRTKAELEKKLTPVRKPYLHESRHLHAMRRARGCGGRFLKTKNLDNAAIANAVTDKCTSCWDANASTVNLNSATPNSCGSFGASSDCQNFENGNDMHRRQVHYIADRNHMYSQMYNSLSDNRVIDDGDWSKQQRERLA